MHSRTKIPSELDISQTRTTARFSGACSSVWWSRQLFSPKVPLKSLQYITNIFTFIPKFPDCSEVCEISSIESYPLFHKGSSGDACSTCSWSWLLANNSVSRTGMQFLRRFVNTYAETDLLFSLSPLLSEVITHKLHCQNNSPNAAFKCFQAQRERREKNESVLKSCQVFCLHFSFFCGSWKLLGCLSQIFSSSFFSHK